MSTKHHNASHSEHASSAHSAAKGPEQNVLFIAVAFALIGIVVGGILASALLGGATAASASDPNAIKVKVEDYFNKKYFPAAGQDGNTVFTVGTVTSIGGGSYELTYKVTKSGATVGDGNFIITKDDVIFQPAIDITKPLPTAAAATPKAATAPVKSDKPKVELFVMSYCPYGTQMEKAILPVVSALKNTVDFKIEFTHFTLHGPKEDTENFRQLCIREEQGTKYLPYLQCILDSNNQSAPADVGACMAKFQIDANAVSSCMATKAADYYKVDSALSQGYGVQGSPTLVINGVQVDSSRSPDAVLKTICSAFTTAPAECNATLPTAQASPGFGYDTTSAADTAAVKCGV